MTLAARGGFATVALCFSWFLVPAASCGQSSAPGGGASVFQDFVTRVGNKLMEGDREFRFMGATMPGLFFPYDYTLQIPERMRMPTAWEQEDGFKTLDQMNMRVTRFWCVPIRAPAAEAEQGGMTWHHIQGPGRYNEESFQALDRALALANRYGVRVIFSIAAAQDYFIQGGIGTYARHRGKPRQAFYTDPQLKEDYKAVVRYILNRKNTVSDIAYKDDKAILAWQFGNEMQDATDAWVAEMAAFIKELDPRHLVAETRSYPSAPFSIDPNVDLYPRHYYPDYKSVQAGWIASCREELAKLKGQRPLLIGEFGPYVDHRMFTPDNVVPKLREFLDFLCAEEGVAGALLWSMYFHHREGGFYWHQIFVYPEVWSYHWPGFPSAAAHGEQGILNAMRQAAFQIQGLPVAPVPRPEAPQLLPVGDAPLLSWRGSAGASGYDIQRASGGGGPWETIARDLSDADVAYRPLYSDETARAGQTWFYRVLARNNTGASEPSNVVGPVNVKRVCQVDELRDLSRAYAKSEGLALTNSYNGLYAEYLFRARGDRGAWLVYQTPAPMTAFRVWMWFTEKPLDPEFQVSDGGVSYEPVHPQRQETLFPSPPGRQSRRTLVEFQGTIPPGNRYFKILWKGPAELDRVEIDHGKQPEA